MAPRLFSSPVLLAIGSALAARYMRLVYKTSKIVRDPQDTDDKLFSQHPQILGMWHGQFLMLPEIKPKKRPADVRCMVARHGDAALVGATLERFGMRLIRGAGAGARKRDRGGAAALREALRALEEGATVAMTADVPPGPARRAGAGIATLGKLSGRPVVPCAVATGRFITLNNWSRFAVNLPFSTLGVVVGEPILVAQDADKAEIEAARVRIEQALAQATARAYALAGAKDPLSTDQQIAGARPGLTLAAYRAFTQVAAPLAPVMLAWRTRFGKEERERRPERYGLASITRPSGFVAWFHAASVGETNAVLPVIEAIGNDHPNMSVLLTTGTVTSAQLAGARLPPRAMHQYLPLDNPGYIQRFLDHWRPDLAVLVESEIWPNLLLETKARKVPLVLVNGRISPRSFKRWRRRPGLSRPLFSCFDLALAQNEMLAQRFTQLGAAEAHGVGNLKADAPPPPVDKEAQKLIASAIAGRPVWLAASTHQGEDEMVASAHIAMKRTKPNLLTIIVPRHPDRGPLIMKQLSALGLNVTLRSGGKLPDAETEIYIADTIGEMGLFYTLAPVAFVGGSLVRRGGQNPVEPIKLGAAVLTGPNFHNFRDSYEELLKAGGAKQVDDAASLGAVALALLNDNAARSDMMARAERALAGMSGALPKTLAALERYLPPKASIEHA
jgi:3-deoxy-D-manno-octulosonic-acid transferase